MVLGAPKAFYRINGGFGDAQSRFIAHFEVATMVATVFVAHLVVAMTLQPYFYA